MDNRQEVLNVVRTKGPVQPSQVATSVNTNILFASAMLSELVQNKHVKITYTKRGGSPFYYVEGQEPKLMDLAEFLKGKVREAYDFLSEELVVRDNNALPWQRVALRELKDFAVALPVNYKGNQEIFWKWYLTPNEEAKPLIKKILTGEKQDSILEEEKSLSEDHPKELEELKEEVQSKEIVQPKLAEEEKPIEKEVPKPIKQVEESTEEDDFVKTIENFISSKEMYIISQNIVRKGRELNYVVDVPSNLGQLRYFVKFKNKKKITDVDLFSALEEANKKKLPVLFLTNGELTKKAQEYINENVSGQLVLKNI
jgi:hypothetical protein